jgi:hypothetical protein
MKRFIFTSIAFLCSAAVFGQVNDQYFENKDAFKTYPQLLPANRNMIVKAMPSFNVDSLLEDDKELEERGGYPFRFGYAFDVDYRLENGEWITDGDRSVWSMRFHSRGAYSLNYAFSELSLSPEAELYVFRPPWVYPKICSNNRLSIFLGSYDKKEVI